MGWTWLVRTGFDPLPAVNDLRDSYRGKGVIDYGELPDYLDPLLAQAASLRPDGADDHSPAAEAGQEKGGRGASGDLRMRVAEWAGRLTPAEAATCVADLLVASKRTDLATGLLDMHIDDIVCDTEVAITNKDSALSEVRLAVGHSWLLNARAKVISCLFPNIRFSMSGSASCLLSLPIASHVTSQIASMTGAQDEAVTLNSKAANVVSEALVQQNMEGNGASVSSEDMLMMDIASSTTTTVRAMESHALALRDGANALRTGAKTDDAFDKAQSLFTEALILFRNLPVSSRSADRRNP